MPSFADAKALRPAPVYFPPPAEWTTWSRSDPFPITRHVVITPSRGATSVIPESGAEIWNNVIPVQGSVFWQFR